MECQSLVQDLWRSFLTRCGTDTCETLYRHITDIIFKDMVSSHFMIQIETEDRKQVELDYNEKNALRYVGGYVTRRLHLMTG